MSKVYIIRQRGFEYNDNWYDETDDINLVRAYADLNEARKYCLELNIKRFRTCGRPSDYCGRSTYDMLKVNPQEFRQRFHEITGVYTDTPDWKWSFPEELSDEQIGRVIEELFLFTFYTLEQVELWDV